jgi:hypothetical protein
MRVGRFWLRDRDRPLVFPFYVLWFFYAQGGSNHYGQLQTLVNRLQENGQGETGITSTDVLMQFTPPTPSPNNINCYVEMVRSFKYIYTKKKSSCSFAHKRNKESR